MKIFDAHGFDHTTAAGQERLMRLSVGQDYPDLGRKNKNEEPTPATLPREAPHPFIGRQVRAVWKPGRMDGISVGEVLDAVPVFESESMRLVILQTDGCTVRAYTADRDWAIEWLT